MFHSALKLTGAALVSLQLLASAGTAGTLEKPKGDVILTISGNIENTNGDGIAEFDIDMLRALGATSFDTSTIWSEGVNGYTGVILSTLLEHVGAKGTQLDATAINDYKVVIPMETLSDAAPIVAYEMDGEPMSRRGKGPLWIIYPYDASADYRTEVVYSYSIWQLNRISVQ